MKNPFPSHFTGQFVLIVLVFSMSCSRNGHDPQVPEKEISVLIFSKTSGFRHESIEAGAQSIKEYFGSGGMLLHHTEDAGVFTKNGLSAYEVILFLNTTGNILDSMQQLAMVDFIKGGKGFVGIHSAADTEYDWPWYAGLAGAQFASHPDIQEAAVVKVDTQHVACKHLPDRWTRTDEWYNFKSVPSGVNVLLTVDEATYQGGTHAGNHPVSWYHTYDGGRSFYTAMGHTVESFQDTMFLRHLYEGTRWAAAQ